MATEQTNIIEAITQAVAEAARVVVWAMAVARKGNGIRAQNVLPNKQTIMKLPTFNWAADYKYIKVKNFIQDVNNVFESYNMPQTERIAVIKIG